MTRKKNQYGNLADTPTIAVSLIGDGGIALWGMTPKARLIRALAKSKRPAAYADQPPTGAAAALLRADWYLEPRVLTAILDNPGVIVTARSQAGETVIAAHAPAEAVADVRQLVAAGGLGGAPIPAGMRVVTVDDICGAYNKALRKAEPPLVASMREHSERAIEWAMYRAAYKGVTDIVTKYVWPIPAFWVTLAASKLKLTPNMVTSVGLLLVLLTQWLFWRGDFWPGLLAAYLMVFLDTVDGKLARVTLTSSKLGNIFDHGIDLIHPPFWWWAWWMGLQATGYAEGSLMAAYGAPALEVILIGYVVGRVAEAIFMHSFGFHIHVWRRLDSVMREITSRRNPNMVILTVSLLFGRPDLGFLAVAVWTLICVPFHIVRLLQAGAERLMGRPIRSWLSE